MKIKGQVKLRLADLSGTQQGLENSTSFKVARLATSLDFIDKVSLLWIEKT